MRDCLGTVSSDTLKTGKISGIRALRTKDKNLKMELNQIGYAQITFVHKPVNAGSTNSIWIFNKN